MSRSCRILLFLPHKYQVTLKVLARYETKSAEKQTPLVRFAPLFFQTKLATGSAFSVFIASDLASNKAGKTFFR